MYRGTMRIPATHIDATLLSFACVVAWVHGLSRHESSKQYR